MSKLSYLLLFTLLLSACKPSLDQQIKDREAARDAFLIKIEKIKNKEVRQTLSQLGWSYFLSEKYRIEHQILPTKTQYSENPFAWINDYKTPQALFDNYVDSIFVLHHSKYIRDSIDISTPLALPFSHQLKWQSVTLENGQTIKVTEEFRPSPPAIATYNGGSRLKVLLEAKNDIPLPTKIQGELRAQVPQKITQFSFTKKDIGKKIVVGKYNVILKTIKNHIVEFELRQNNGENIDSDKNLFMVAAKDKTKNYLSSSGWAQSPEGNLNDYFKVLKKTVDEAIKGEFDAENSEEEIQQRFSDLDANKPPKKLILSYYFHGFVEHVDIIINSTETKEIVRNLDISMREFGNSYTTDSNIEKFSSNATIYDHKLDYLLEEYTFGKKNGAPDRTDFSSEQIASEIRISDPRLYHGDNHIDFTYPKSKSDLFFNQFDRFSNQENEHEINFYDTNGNKINLSEKPYTFNGNRYEIRQASFPTSTIKATGFLTINTAPDMIYEKFPVTTNQLPEGIIVKDNMIIKSRNYFDNSNVRVLAMSDDNKFLHLFNSAKYNFNGKPSQHVSYYYGKPTKILIIKRGKTKKIRYEFDFNFTLLHKKSSN